MTSACNREPLLLCRLRKQRISVFSIVSLLLVRIARVEVCYPTYRFEAGRQRCEPKHLQAENLIPGRESAYLHGIYPRKGRA